jgi:4-amino-4-deoxy-L-arabinose transferase-like glycosyltransferase
LHPPLTSILLAGANLASATDVFDQRVFFALIFGAAVVVVGLTVRALAGGRAGVLAASIVAIFPPLWVNPVTLGPETVVIALVSLLLYGAVRFWARPSATGAAEIGAYLGLCILTRTDLVALVFLIGLPLAFLARPLSWTERAKCAGIMVVLAALIVAPWAARNLATFSRTTLVSDDAGSVLAGANCPASYVGNRAGWWSSHCTVQVPVPRGDQSVAAAALRTAGQQYAQGHESAFVRVGLIRVGRLWNVYDPVGQARLETAVGRPFWVSSLSLFAFYLLVPLAALGAVVLRHRRALLFPFVALVVLSTVTAFAAYGDARFRVEADVALAALGGVALDALWRGHERRARPEPRGEARVEDGARTMASVPDPGDQ